jgi:hypothetical protein
MRLSVYPWVPAFLVLSVLAALPCRANVIGDDFNDEEQHDYNGMPKLRLSLEAGYSQWMYNPDGMTKSYERYTNAMESGMNTAAQLAWFPWPKGGIGAEWIWFLSKASADNVIISDANPTPHRLKDRASFVYYGPTFLSRLQFGRFGLIVAGFGAGYLDIRDAWTDNGIPNLVTAKTFAVVTNVGWEYSFYRLVSLGLNGRVLLSNVTDYTYNGKKIHIDQPDDPHYWSNITFTRFELDAGIRFGL